MSPAGEDVRRVPGTGAGAAFPARALLQVHREVDVRHSAIREGGAAGQVRHLLDDDVVNEVRQVLAARHVELHQRSLHAVLEHLLQAVPGVVGALACLADARFDRTADLIGAATGEAPCGLLEVHAFLDQRLEQLGALGLGAAEQFAGFLLGAEFQIAFVFSLLVVVLLWRSHRLRRQRKVLK